MLLSNIKVAFRQLRRNKVFSIINFASLITGITIFFFIANFVNYEYSFEDFNLNAHRTYRVNLYNTHNGVFDQISAETVSGLGYAMGEISGIEAVARVSYKTKGIVENSEKQFKQMEEGIVYADSNLFRLMGIPLKTSNKAGVSPSKTILISKTIADKYFGGEAALGKILDIGFNNNSLEPVQYEVVAVFDDIPENANLRFDIVLPVENIKEWNQNWDWSNVFTFVLLRESHSPESIAGSLAKIVTMHHAEDTGDRYILEPITQIRLHALDGTGRSRIVNYFLALGFTILFLAWINYVNLSTSRFLERLKEVGLRKLIGANRRTLVMQQFLEAFIFNILSFIVSLILFFVSWPYLHDWVGGAIPNTLLSGNWVILLAVLIVIVGTVVSGLYPAFYLSAFQPLQTLQGKSGTFNDRVLLRKVLVTVQLCIALILVFSIFTIREQIAFMKNQQIGLSIDKTIVIEEPLLTDNTSINSFEPFKKQILQYPFVQGVTYASSFPGSEIDWHRTDITLNEENADFKYDSRIISVGTEFLAVFNLPLVAGRNFNPTIETDNKAMLINEKAAAIFGFQNLESALGKFVFIGNRKFEVIGVVKNYHFQSLKYQMQPLLFIQGYPRNPSYAIKIVSNDYQHALQAIEKIWKNSYPGNVFSHYLLDEHFADQYLTEEQTIMMIETLTIFAFVICASGLFGLSLYTINKRNKEIGIRKVLGASVTSVVMLLVKEYLMLILIACLLGIPLAFFMIKTWINSYAYQTPIHPHLFAIPVVLITLLTLLAVGYQSVRSAKKNPVDSIKYE